MNFIVAGGVIPNSFIIFSDVHEQYEHLGAAIAQVMANNDGCVPSLVVCTGDWVNGLTVSTESIENEHLPKIFGQLGGLDTVYVTGNHEVSGGSKLISTLAVYSVDPTDLNDGVGLLFDSAINNENKQNSLEAEGLEVYGIDFFALTGNGEGENRTAYNYKGILPELEEYLITCAQENDHNLIVIAAHADLHVMGLQPESLRTNGSSLEAWSGSSAYHIDGADAVADLLNRYAREYGLDIIFFFGHNHSMGEAEFFLATGDELISPVAYSERSYVTVPLGFFYGHAGYLSDTKGAAINRYTLVTWDEDSIHRTLFQLDKEEPIEDVEYQCHEPQATDTLQPAA